MGALTDMTLFQSNGSNYAVVSSKDGELAVVELSSPLKLVLGPIKAATACINSLVMVSGSM